MKLIISGAVMLMLLYPGGLKSQECPAMRGCEMKREMEVERRPRHKKMKRIRYAERVLKLKDELNLTADQEKKIRNVQLEAEKEQIRKGADRKIHQAELKAIQRSSEIDFEKAKAKARQISKVNEDMMISKIELREKVYGILTKKQLEKLKSLKSRRKGHKKRAKQKK